MEDICALMRYKKKVGLQKTNIKIYYIKLIY